jgi:hypothetical protein
LLSGPKVYRLTRSDRHVDNSPSRSKKLISFFLLFSFSIPFLSFFFSIFYPFATDNKLSTYYISPLDKKCLPISRCVCPVYIESISRLRGLSLTHNDGAPLCLYLYNMSADAAVAGSAAACG